MRVCLRSRVALGLVLLSACGGGSGESPDAGTPVTYDQPDAGPSIDDDARAYLEATASVFDRTRRLPVDLQLAPKDWWAIGSEGRGLSAISCKRAAEAQEPFTYAWFSGEVSVDGETLANVGVRKKGFLGSLSISRPSLKLDFERFEAQREFRALEKLTLNNSRQDASRIRQCTAYLLFARAGVAAPRCSFAHVRVNGTDLGTYANVESISKRFLRSRFGSDSGNLYEGQGADFLSAKWASFDAKTSTTTDSTNLERLRDALMRNESERVAALEKVMDVDAYLTYWAMESLLASWDSYSTTSNNFFLYDDPRGGFRFIPWGPDATLNEKALTGGDRPQSISADSDVSGKLWEIPSMRARYVTRMRELLDRIWKVDEIIAEIDRMAQLVPDADATELEQIRQFVRRRREVVTAELDKGPMPLPASKICFNAGQVVSGSFRGTWPASASAPSAGTFEWSVEGQPVPLTSVTVTGASVALMGPPGVGVVLSGTQADRSKLNVQLQVEPSLFSAQTIPMVGLASLGMVQGARTQDGSVPFALLSDGFITFSQAGKQPGDVVAGTFEGRMYQIMF